MPFAKEFTDVYKLGIKPACINAGAYCERLDEQIYDEGMLDRIYNQIAKADIVVADMSGQNSNVFYEVGYAHALGKKVILITKSADDIPFDLAHRFHLVYGDSISDLGEQLEERMKCYVRDAGKRSLSDVDRLEFYIDGQAIEGTNNSAFPIEWKHYSNSMVWWVAIAVHNPRGVNVTDVRFGADLIVPDVFSFCLNHEFADIDNIALPGRKFLHQRLKEDSIPPGGWRQLVFPLIQNSELPLPEHSEIVLHVLSNGLAREISFVIKTVLPN